MMEGTHDPLKSIRADYPDVDLVTADDGALIPARLAARQSGWQGDRSHDEGLSERLRALYRRMDSWAHVVQGAKNPERLIRAGIELANTWQEIREEMGR